MRPQEIERAISYFQEAIGMDPHYALAYAGLADAYRALSLSNDMPPDEFFPKSKAAARKAIDLDDHLAEGHAVLGFSMFWSDWNWTEAENQFRRALELNPNSADARWGYGHLLSNLGRHEEALSQMKLALELDPLSLMANTAYGGVLLHGGQTEEALNVFDRVFELDPNFWLAHHFASSAYIDRGMFQEAITEARKAKAIMKISTNPDAFLGYALSKSGKEAEAHILLQELLKLSSQRYVPPYHIAMIYQGLNQREEALTWLERGFQQKDPKMVFLKVERKWNSLRSDPRFQSLMQGMNFD
jgi:serine/threonine-protein kinase